MIILNVLLGSLIIFAFCNTIRLCKVGEEKSRIFTELSIAIAFSFVLIIFNFFIKFD